MPEYERVIVCDSRQPHDHRGPGDSVVEMPPSHLHDAYVRDPRIARRKIAALVRLRDGARVLAARSWPVAGSRAELEIWAPSRALLALIDRAKDARDNR